MSDLLTGDGRTHIRSNLMRESLQDRGVIESVHTDNEIAIFPDVVFVSIGGQSIFDRGRDAILPVAAELGAIKDAGGVTMVLGVGGGTRLRHTLSIAMDLGLPTGASRSWSAPWRSATRSS